MRVNAIEIRPFEVGWKVFTGRRSRETVTGRRETAVEIAQYYARRESLADVVIYRNDGSVEETVSCEPGLLPA